MTSLMGLWVGSLRVLSNAVNKKKNWCFRIMTKFRECNLELYTDLENILHKNVIA